jgi:hypothetical protein
MTLNTIPATMALLLLSATISFAQELKVSPHSDNGDCAICHVAPTEKLRSWFAFGSTKREMKPDLDKICRGCHVIEPEQAGSLGVGKGHAAGKKPAINVNNLPLAKDGTINCATTCHNLHISSDAKPSLVHKRLRASSNELCTSCHKI